MVGREVDGPLWAVLVRSQGYVDGFGSLSGPLGAVLGRYRASVGGLGSL